MSEDRIKLALGFSLRKPYGTEYLTVWPAMLINYGDRSTRFLGGWNADSERDLHLENLQIDCFTSDTDGRLVDVGYLHYRQPYTVNLYTARRMVKTLDKGQRAFEKWSPIDFGDKVRAMAGWLKVGAIVHQKGERQEIEVYDVANGIYQIRELMKRMEAEAQARLPARAA